MQRTIVNRRNAEEYSLHHFVTESSALQLLPSEWPRRIKTDLGNGQDFLFRSLEANGEIARYEQGNGCLRLSIYND